MNFADFNWEKNCVPLEPKLHELKLTISNWDIFFDCKIQFSKVLYLKTEFLWNWNLLENSLKARFLSVCFHVLVSRAFPQLLDPQHEQASLLFEPRQGGINAKLPQNYCFWWVLLSCGLQESACGPHGLPTDSQRTPYFWLICGPP